MPRYRMMDRRMSRDGRGMRRMHDRGMNYAYDRGDYRGGDYEYDSRRGDRAYSEQDMARGRRDYESMGQHDMGYDDIDMRRRRNAKGQYMSDRAYEDYGSFHEERGFRPVEAMGYFTGYYGGGQDMARGSRRDYGYDMRGHYDYGYDYAGDYGENLTEEELKRWCQKMMSELDEREKQMFSKESILQRAKNMGIQFDKFSEMEFYVNVVKNYTDHKKSIGENPDMAIKLARDDFNDEDGEYKGSEWLAVYYDTFVEGE